MRAVILGFAGVVAGVGAVLALVLGALVMHSAMLTAPDCPGSEGFQVAGPAPLQAGDLTSTQTARATTVIRVGQQLGVPTRAIVVALATAAVESRFLRYANDGQGTDLAPDQRGISVSMRLPHDAVGSDHGSLGVFQQQWPWWGSMRQLMDPASSARLFYRALLDVPGWEGMPIGQAAQMVQKSAFPSRYATAEPLARTLIETLGVDSPLADDPEPCGTAVTTRAGDWHLPLPAGSYSVSSP